MISLHPHAPELPRALPADIVGLYPHGELT